MILAGQKLGMTSVGAPFLGDSVLFTGSLSGTTSQTYTTIDSLFAFSDSGTFEVVPTFMTPGSFSYAQVPFGPVDYDAYLSSQGYSSAWSGTLDSSIAVSHSPIATNWNDVSYVGPDTYVVNPYTGEFQIGSLAESSAQSLVAPPVQGEFVSESSHFYGTKPTHLRVSSPEPEAVVAAGVSAQEAVEVDPFVGFVDVTEYLEPLSPLEELELQLKEIEQALSDLETAAVAGADGGGAIGTEGAPGSKLSSGGVPPNGSGPISEKEIRKLSEKIFDFNNGLNQLFRAPGDHLKCFALSLNNSIAPAFKDSWFYQEGNPFWWFTNSVKTMLGCKGAPNSEVHNASAAYAQWNSAIKGAGYLIGVFADIVQLRELIKEKFEESEVRSKAFEIAKTLGSLGQRFGFLLEKGTFFMIKRKLAEALFSSAVFWRMLGRYSSIAAMFGSVIFSIAMLIDGGRQKRKAERLGLEHKEDTAQFNLAIKLIIEAIPRIMTQVHVLWSYTQLKAYQAGELTREQLHPFVQDSLDKMEITNPSMITEESLYLWLKGGFYYPTSWAITGVAIAGAIGVFSPIKNFRALGTHSWDAWRYKRQDVAVPKLVKENLLAAGLGSAASIPTLLGGVFAAYPATDQHAFFFLAIGGILISSQFMYNHKEWVKKQGRKVRDSRFGRFVGGALAMFGRNKDQQDPDQGMQDGAELLVRKDDDSDGDGSG